MAAVEDRPIREIMTAPPISVQEDLSVQELMHLFETHDFNLFPVVDPGGHLVGVVTKLDLLTAVRPGRGHRFSDAEPRPLRRVREIMRHGVVAVAPSDPVVKAVDLLVEHGIRAVPVVERRPEGLVLVGLVSPGDLLRCLTLHGAPAPSPPRGHDQGS
jgi:CBS-domain-containing membrane protein